MMEELMIESNLNICKCGTKFLKRHRRNGQKLCIACRRKRKENWLENWQEFLISECSKKHNNCFDCETDNGDCLFD